MKNMNPNNEIKCVTAYADHERLYGMGVMTAIFAFVIIFFAYAVMEAYLLWQKIVWIIMAIVSAFAFSKISISAFKAYLPKAKFYDECVECTFLGKPLKILRWDEIADIVCVTFVRRGKGVSMTDYLVFSGHILSDEEKTKSIQLAGLKNDIIVTKYSDRLVKQIDQIHEFTFENESKAKKN